MLEVVTCFDGFNGHSSYAGPDSQLVTDEFKLDWSTYLGSSENVIYASIDGRGSSARGNDFLHQVYYKLGTIEVQDQIDGTKYYTTVPALHSLDDARS